MCDRSVSVVVHPRATATNPLHDNAELPSVRIEGLVTNLELAARLTVPDQPVAGWEVASEVDALESPDAAATAAGGDKPVSHTHTLLRTHPSEPDLVLRSSSPSPSPGPSDGGSGVAAPGGTSPKVGGARRRRRASFSDTRTMTGLTSSLLVSEDVYEDLCDLEVSGCQLPVAAGKCLTRTVVLHPCVTPHTRVRPPIAGGR